MPDSPVSEAAGCVVACVGMLMSGVIFLAGFAWLLLLPTIGLLWCIGWL